MPDVTGDRLGAHAEVAVADSEVGAGGATPFDESPSILEATHQRIGGVEPDVPEGAPPHVAENVRRGKRSWASA